MNATNASDKFSKLCKEFRKLDWQKKKNTKKKKKNCWKKRQPGRPVMRLTYLFRNKFDGNHKNKIETLSTIILFYLEPVENSQLLFKQVRKYSFHEWI